MPRHVRKARIGTNRTNFYEDITRKIIAELEAGCVPWVQPWETAAAKAPLAMPQNAVTRRRYGGINILILMGAAVERGFSGQSWLTFRQAMSLGGCVRKGERGTTVVYADRFVPAEEMKRASMAGDEAQAIPFLKRFTVHGAGDGKRFRFSDRAPSARPAGGSLDWGLRQPDCVRSVTRAVGLDPPYHAERPFNRS
jgi:antirestriction protein ArdC